MRNGLDSRLDQVGGPAFSSFGQFQGRDIGRVADFTSNGERVGRRPVEQSPIALVMAFSPGQSAVGKLFAMLSTSTLFVARGDR